MELTAKQRNKIKRAVKALNDVRRELQDQYPENKINWYLEDCGNLCLMSGDTHSDNLNVSPLFENIVEVYDFEMASGGGW